MLDLDTFNRWTSYHESCWRGFNEYLAEQPERWKVWAKALDGYSIDELKQASHAVFMQPEKPIGWTSHMEAMQRHLRSYRAIAREQEQAAMYARRCGLCEGTGMVSVVAIDGAKFVTLSGFKHDHGTAACKCGLGDKYRTKDHNGVQHGFPDYDATTMVAENVHRLRNRVVDAERDEAAKTMRGTVAYCKEAFAKFGSFPSTEPAT